MNSNTVLGKIMTLLSLESKEGEEKLTIAKLADGTLVESPTFDVGESVEVIHEDGTKTPAPNGEHLLELKDESGNINRIKIFTEDGIIKERENVEIEAEEEKKEEELADVETKEVEKLPESGEVTELPEQVTLESEEESKEEEMVDEEVVDKDADEIVTLKEHEEKLKEHSDKIEEMKERIEELGKYIDSMKEEEEKLEEEEKKEEELESKRLDGAPVEKQNFNKTKKNTWKIPNSHNSVLSKLYR